MGIERRQYKRIEIDGEVLISYRAGQSSVTVSEEVAIKDISVGGARVSTEVPYPLSFNVSLNISLPTGQIEMEGTIIRIVELEENEAYDLGIKFSDLSDDSFRRLQEFIALKSSEDEGDNS